MNAAKIVAQLLENDDVDAKDFIVSPPVPKEILVVGRRWFQKTYGNTYNAATIYVDGQLVGTTPKQYGYGDQYLTAAWEWLEQNLIVPKHQDGDSATESARKLGIKLEYYAHDVRRQRDL